MTLYYEAHVTVDPLYGYKLDHFKVICDKYGFRVADLLMQKREIDTPERSKYDTFCTGRGDNLEDLSFKLTDLIKELQKNDIHVWRYKLEDAIVDSKILDLYKIIRKANSGQAYN